MAITLNGTTGITTPAIDNQGNLTVDGGTIKLDGNYPVGSQNVALGNAALDSGSLSGNYNTALGSNAFTNLTTGNNNLSVGAYAGQNHTTGSNNVFVGEETAVGNTTGSSNTAVGRTALYSNTTASYNTAVGYQAGYSNTTGTGNTLVGNLTGYSLTTGTGNTFLGGGSNAAGYFVTTGSKNTIVGQYNGNQGGLDIRTSNNNIVLSDGDGNPRMYVAGNGVVRIGRGVYGQAGGGLDIYPQGSGDNGYIVWNKDGNGAGGGTRTAMLFANNGTTVGSVSYSNTSTAYNTSSDYRLKENVVDLTGATERLNQIPVRRFNFIADADTTVDGFLAHEVQAVVPEAITGTHNEVDDDGNPVYQGIDQSKLVPLLVKAIQELEARITALENA